MRVIFVPVAARLECEGMLEAAFAVARRLKSDVIGCHIQPQGVDPADWTVAEMWARAQTQTWPISSEAEQREAAEAARRIFVQAAERAGYEVTDKPGTPELPRAHWEVRIGSPPDLMPLIGAASDLVVVSRPPPSGGYKAWMLLMGALLESTRPVLVVPQEPTEISGKRLAVAWNRGTKEILLLHSTLPMLRQAEDVVLVTVGEERKRGPSSEDIQRYLTMHGVRARTRSVGGSDVAGVLVDTARAEGADLLLAGAYTRGRMREIVFGGVTEHLVNRTKFPVLLMHG